MKIIEPCVKVWPFSPMVILKELEEIGRVCYKSEDKMGLRQTAAEFLEDKIAMGHESIIEHEKVRVTVICDRGISHEIVRHRIAAYSQESTRYCRYDQQRFGNEITVIDPWFFKDIPILYEDWIASCQEAEKRYMSMLKKGASAQEARSVLPNSLKTEIVITYNLREWRHFFSLRAAKPAHPQMRQIAIPLLQYFKLILNPLFDDIEYDADFPPEHYAKILKK